MKKLHLVSLCLTFLFLCSLPVQLYATHSEDSSSGSAVVVTESETEDGFWLPVVASDRFGLALTPTPYVQLSIARLLKNNMEIEYTVELSSKLSKPLTLTLQSWVTDIHDNETIFVSSNHTCVIQPKANHTFTYAFSMPFAPNVFTAFSALKRTYVLHVIALDPQAKLQTEELVTTITVDGTQAKHQICILVGLVSFMVWALYFGLKPKKGKEAESTRSQA